MNELEGRQPGRGKVNELNIRRGRGGVNKWNKGGEGGGGVE